MVFLRYIDIGDVPKPRTGISAPVLSLTTCFKTILAFLQIDRQRVKEENNGREVGYKENGSWVGAFS